MPNETAEIDLEPRDPIAHPHYPARVARAAKPSIVIEDDPEAAIDEDGDDEV